MENLVNQACKQASEPDSHDFIYLEISNYDDLAPKVIKFYQNGLSLRDIESRVGLSKSKVRSLLRRYQIPLRELRGETRRITGRTKANIGTKPPYGFCFDEGAVVRHPKEYPHLLAIIQRWQRGQALNSIATWLNGKRIPSPMGKNWSWNSVANIIQRIKKGQLIEVGGKFELR